MDAIILAVAHDAFKALTPEIIGSYYRPGSTKVLLDLKGLLNKSDYVDAGYLYWRL